LAQLKIHRADGKITGHPSRTGNMPDIESLFLRYSHLIYLVCNKYFRNEEESKDAVMEIFLKLLVDSKDYSIANLPAWLHAVAKNHCLMKIRKTANTKVIYLPPDELDAFDMENDDFAHHEDTKPIDWDELLGRLNKEQKTCVEMFYFQKKSYKEIAHLSSMSVNEVKSHLQNGKRNLKKLLEEAERKNA
jgi:RNA polymerase sigma factor (sigma-70 family)